jgi:hypothetical protein
VKADAGRECDDKKVLIECCRHECDLFVFIAATLMKLRSDVVESEEDMAE